MCVYVQVTSALLESTKDGKDMCPNVLQEMDSSFATRNNFCNSFSIVTVLPCLGTVLHESVKDHGHKHFVPVQCGLQVAHSMDPVEMQAHIDDMQRELEKLKTGVSAYIADPNREANLHKHAFMSSPLRNMPHLSTIIKLQQGLQQAYCMDWVQVCTCRCKLVLSVVSR